MNGFQYIGLTFVGLMALLTASALFRGRGRRPTLFVWLIVWCGAGVALLHADATTAIAQRLGIKRGADLLLYTFVLTSGALFLWVYGRLRQVNRQVTLLVRELALRGATPGADSPADEDENR